METDRPRPSLADDFVRRQGFLTLGSRLRRLGERLQAQTQGVMDAHGVALAASHYPYLAALDEHGPLSIGELAGALGLSQPGVTRNVGALTDAGLVAVERAPGDQRLRLARLTDAGQALVRQGRESLWPQIARCVEAAVAAEPLPLLVHLDRLEAALDGPSFVQRLAASPAPGQRHG